MKRLLFLAGILASMSAGAQYSQWVYGGPNSYEESYVMVKCLTAPLPLVWAILWPVTALSATVICMG